jgi:hypothetical protein
MSRALSKDRRLVMSSAAAIVACALALLGRSEKTMPPITLVEAPPKHASIEAEAFVSLPDPHIYVITSSPVFLDAMASRSSCTESPAMKKLASILAHEEWHILHGKDESGAYYAQLTTLLRLGVAPDNNLYRSVQKSMQAVLKKRNRKPDLVLAGGQ